MSASDATSRRQLQEAIRKIQVMAGLNDARTIALHVSRPAGPAPVVDRGFKSVRGGRGTAPVQIPQQEPSRALIIGVTSPGHRDGKTTIAMSLANSLAHDFNTSAALVDVDFETHSIGAEYGLFDRPGVSNVLAGNASLASVTNRYRGAPLSVITAGTAPADPARLARSEHLPMIISATASINRFVVLDLPAALPSSNAAILARHCDGVLVVARAGATSRHDIEATLDLLQDSNVLGVILNRQKTHVPRWVDRVLALPR